MTFRASPFCDSLYFFPRRVGSLFNFLKFRLVVSLRRISCVICSVVITGKWSEPIVSLSTLQDTTWLEIDDVASVRSSVDGRFPGFSLVGTPGVLSSCRAPISIALTRYVAH